VKHVPNDLAEEMHDDPDRLYVAEPRNQPFKFFLYPTILRSHCLWFEGDDDERRRAIAKLRADPRMLAALDGR